MLAASLPETKENTNPVRCKDCAFFNPLMAICSNPKEVDSKGICSDFRMKKDLPKTRMPPEILNPVFSHKLRKKIKRVKKTDLTFRGKKEIAPKEKYDDQSLKRVFSKLVGSQYYKKKEREVTVKHGSASIFEMLSLKKDEEEPEDKMKKEDSKEKETKRIKIQPEGRHKSPFEILSPQNDE